MRRIKRFFNNIISRIASVGCNTVTPPTKETNEAPQECVFIVGGDFLPSLKDVFLQKYPQRDSIVALFESANNCEFAWHNITKVRLQMWVDYMAQRLAPNSVHQYCAKLKVVLNMYSDEVELPKGWEKILSPRKCASTAVFLNESELQRLIDYQPNGNAELFVRNTFILSAFTGARLSDSTRFSADNIVGDTLQYVAVKTKKPQTLPLKPIVAEYIRNKPKLDIGEQKFNEILRRICYKVKLDDNVHVFHAGKEHAGAKYNFIGSHTARRSFASNLYLRGVDIYTISKLLGHASVNTTQRYIQAGVKMDSKELLGYFA